jgi:RimJ/RimL family protein N-acetyltransferase
MSQGFLSLRRAASSDCALVFEWANDPVTRANSFSPQAISWEDHKTWFDRILQDPERELFVLLASSEPIGQARLARASADGDDEISLALAPAWRGLGLAAEAIRLVTRESGALVVHAYVKTGNDASIRAFLRAGYVEVGDVEREGKRAVHLTIRGPQTGAGDRIGR